MNCFVKLFSYFKPIQLEQLSTPINPYLEVLLTNGKLQLNTPNATYSHENLYSNFFDCFKKIKIQQQQFKKVLVLGGGLCSIPQMLLQKFNQKGSIEVVEIDEAIIVLAKKYVNKAVLQKVQFYNLDALTFCKNNKNHKANYYNLICIDVFLDNKTPADFQKNEFIKNIYSMLNKNGIVIYNCFASNSQEKILAQQFYEQTFGTCFTNPKIFNVSGNKMLVGSK